MFWKFVETAAALYAVGFVFLFPLGMGICKSNSHLRDQEDYDAYNRWEARNLEEEKALYRH